MRTFRHARLFAAAGITIATLALTACESGTGTKDEGASKLTPTPTASATDDTKGSQPTNSGSGKTSQPNQTGQSNQGNETTEKSDKTTDQAGKPSSNPAICNGSNTKVTAQPVSRPLNHMLLTVTNTGSKACSLMYYPVLRFDEMQWVPQARPDSKPQAVPTLAPGASGYAGVMLAAADGSGDGGTTGKKLTIAFQGGTPNSSGGASATPPLPAKGVYYDSSLSVTYWQSDMADALN
ncbi:DUF4232 domain-containing protein [Streptomyces sp. NPDC050211]|uniref:DUF4232 domain-containing protein n=1 Tax=Streptomyces sp. NPDC050211 TaxID=3154932 RepID=UPI0034444789